MLKTYDSTLQAFIERDSAKYYDTARSAWVNAESAKTYDASLSAWVERLLLNFEYVATVAGSNLISTDVVTVSDNMASISSPVASANKRLEVVCSEELKAGDVLTFDIRIDGTNPADGSQPNFYMEFVISGVQFYKNSGETVHLRTNVTQGMRFGSTDGMIEQTVTINDFSYLYTGEYDYYKLHGFRIGFFMSPTVNNCGATITNLKINGKRVRLTS